MEAQKYDKIQHLSHSLFKRCTGVTKFVFELMVLVVEKWEKDNQKKEGRPNKLSTADQVLMMLEYYRSGGPSRVQDIFSYGFRLWIK